MSDENLKHNKIQPPVENFTENPDTVNRRLMAQSAASNPINMKNYENMGGVTHLDSMEAIKNHMMAKQMAAGVKIVEEDQAPKRLNLGGINDNRVKGPMKPLRYKK